jgi:leucyl-tRNA---protein transferase
MNAEINEYMEREELSLKEWELLLLSGWDRVGHTFYRRMNDYAHIFLEDEFRIITLELMPLRYRLFGEHQFSKSQRKNKRKNSDLRRVYGPATIDETKLELFNRWYSYRFGKEGSLFSWVSGTDLPFPTHELCVYKEDKLIACSFFDVTPHLQYSTTGFFDPDEAHRSLGTYTLISEIEYGMACGKSYHYPGHAYLMNSMYDYKKNMPNPEHFDWATQTWKPLIIG